MWVPPEIKDPVRLHAPTRKSVACTGAVSVRTGTFVRSLCARLKTFLKTLLRHRDHSTRIVLVLDNARYHHTVLLKPLRRKYRQSSPGCFCPRLATHNRFFATLDDVLTAISACFDRWRKPNSVLRRLYGII